MHALATADKPPGAAWERYAYSSGAYGDCGRTFLGTSGLRGTNPRFSVDGGVLRNSGVQ
jgi:hypothetical protein